MLEQRFFRGPLLRVLAAAGGALSRSDALAAMGVDLAGALRPDDRVPMMDRPTEEGWRNRTSWEVKVLKEEGLMLTTARAGRGRWALSRAGMDAADSALKPSDPAGSPYVEPPRPRPVSAAEPFDVDPDLIDRGLAAHHDIVQELARWVRSHGWTPLEPAANGPAYDLAWRASGAVNVAEIKSLTAANEERQMRLGLGQVLRYRQALETTTHSAVQAWLVVEREPADLAWQDLCRDVDIRLAWPATLP